VDKAIVYSKQTDEPLVPVTVRIEWLPDGKIKPLVYWMPDGSRFDVRHIYECTKIAHLKDRGAGIRFKVKSELVDSSEFDDELLFTQQETYLYFADDWFCGKSFIDERYGHAGKVFIPVTLDVFPSGDYTLIYFTVHGARYAVEKTHEIAPRGSFSAGGVGVWHKVDARIINDNDDENVDPNKSVVRPAALYFEINKWFVVKAV
jgi:hypothetical protein